MFCPKCGTLLRPKKAGKKLAYYCPSCGYESENSPKGNSQVVTKVASDEGDLIIESEERIAAPIVEARCPKCGNEQAYVEIVQTRAADEPPTRIYTCTKCKHSWREYS
ncbi:MAG: transcription factor S [Candidatus Korarchaeum sp.]|nr:transcription factor S [Candidatus Korarchaeum sp.]MDW8035958.1 transcription factor S [Candidatus Korarchaeum sp.]